MNYMQWVHEYLEEAGRLKNRLHHLRQRAKTAECNEAADKLYRRIGMLNDMYLDCLHTAYKLLEWGR